MDSTILSVITSRTLTYEQKVASLARAAENSLSILRIDPGTQALRERGIICDLGEGAAPYRPRYILPDYARFIAQGSKFLELPPPADLDEALDSLLILYRHVPSITGFPVFVGALDELLEAFVLRDPDPKPKIARFLRHIDRTVTDSFCQANVGPRETLAGRLVLEAAREWPEPTPNISFLYDPSTTPEPFAELAAAAALDCARPSFANHPWYSRENPAGYGIASCYNALPIGGGAYTLVRLKLSELARTAADRDDFLSRALPDAASRMCGYVDERIRFLVGKSGFFKSSFLATEGLIRPDRFTAMFGVVGLAECVNFLLRAVKPEERFGHSDAAEAFGLEVMETLRVIVDGHRNPLCIPTGERFSLHAQVGLSDDVGTSPGCRIPIGEEPPLHEHLLRAAPFHDFFPSGIGDIFAFEPGAKRNPAAIVDVVKGAFASGMRFLSFYADDSDVVRISGYLVKRSEMARLSAGKAALRDTTALGRDAAVNLHALDRPVRTLDESLR
ncbi:MAG: YjjI family glycine radical enzyme [Spirochaetes bacterium]|nr:YjjI family glycine radical enzyme [Spirochaetota bacterium]